MNKYIGMIILKPDIKKEKLILYKAILLIYLSKQQKLKEYGIWEKDN